MTKVLLLQELKEFTGEVLKNETLPVREQRQDGGKPPKDRAPATFLMRLPDVGADEKKVPYVLHQVVTGHDGLEKTGGSMEMTARTAVRSVFCVYDKDRERGNMALLELMERFRVSLLERVVIGGQFMLDLEEGISSVIYPPDAADMADPYYKGEMVTSWILPPIHQLAAVEIASGGKRVTKPLT